MAATTEGPTPRIEVWMYNDGSTKRCSECGEIKPPTEFTDGMSKCRPCRARLGRERYAVHGERINARQKAVRNARKDELNAHRREHAKKHRDWFRYIEAKRAARERGATGGHAFEDVQDMLESQGWLCAYCETPLGDDYHTDHMTSIARGGDDNWDNIAVVCSRCNFRKHRLTLEEYVNSYLYDVENGVAAIMATGLEALTWRQIAAALGFERTVPRRWMSECGLRAEKRFVDGHWAYHVERDDLVAFIRERAVS